MNSSQLSGETIFITGATSGFGEACARLLVTQGARLVLCGRRENKLKTLQQELGDNIHMLTMDVSDRKQVENAIASLPDKFKNITVLINNAGLALGMEPAYKSMLDDWEQMVDTNIKGVLYCTHAILPMLVKQNKGYIINIGSTAGNHPYPGGNVYGATKAFLKQFSLNLRADLLGTTVRVTNIEPGMAETEFSLVRFKGDTAKAKNLYSDMSPINANDIAETVLWLITRPLHINVNRMEIMPTCQAFSHLAVHRKDS